MTAFAQAERSPRVAEGSVTPQQVSTYRPDIQGLRAVAVLAVAFDHAHLHGFTGGFVGVDVFFVISGFLITQLLLREAQRTGSISLTQFYGRRARRILPAATLVLVTTVIASVVLLGYVRATSVITDSIWATFFAANVKFGRDGTDYFSNDNPPSPLQHYWSLSIEEQFYFVWPVLLLVLLAVALLWRRRRRAGRPAARVTPATGHRLPKAGILAVLLLLGGASLVYAINLTDQNPTAAYFSTPARVWELATGALCAVLIDRVAQLPGWLRATTAWVGLGAVAVAIFHYTALTVFPGKAALLPVLGAALVIAGGAGSPKAGPTVILGRKGCRLIGDWSYSIYLWHWPFLILAAGYLERPLTTAESVLLLLAAVAVSALTYRYVENPFRRARSLSRRPRRSLLLYPAAFAVTLAGCLVAHDMIEHQIAAAADAPPIAVAKAGTHTRDGVRLSSDPAIALVQSSVIAAKQGDRVPGHLTPPLLGLKNDIAQVGHCEYKYDIRTLCKRGDVGSSRSIVVFGDSHARAWIPAFQQIAEQDGYAAYYLVKPGCNATQMAPDFGSGAFEGCLNWRTWAIGQIQAMHPDVLIVANDLPPGILGPNGQPITNVAALGTAFQHGLTKSLHELEPDVGRIVVMGDVPGLQQDPGACLSQPGANLGDCAFPRSHRSRVLFDAAHAVALSAGYQFIDPIPWFCADNLCPSVIGSMVTYRDTEHITTEYAAKLAGPLGAKLNLAAPK